MIHIQFMQTTARPPAFEFAARLARSRNISEDAIDRAYRLHGGKRGADAWKPLTWSERIAESHEFVMAESGVWSVAS